MTAPTTEPAVKRSFWIISIAALLWNLMGVFAYLMSVTLSPEALAAMSEADQELYNQMPAWVTGAYAIAVFGGTLGCVLLLMRKSLAVPVFIVSLIAIVLQMGYSLFLTPVLEVRGATAAILPVFVILVGVYLVWFSSQARKEGVLT